MMVMVNVVGQCSVALKLSVTAFFIVETLSLLFGNHKSGKLLVYVSL